MEKTFERSIPTRSGLPYQAPASPREELQGTSVAHTNLGVPNFRVRRPSRSRESDVREDRARRPRRGRDTENRDYLLTEEGLRQYLLDGTSRLRSHFERLPEEYQQHPSLNFFIRFLDLFNGRIEHIVFTTNQEESFPVVREDTQELPPLIAVIRENSPEPPTNQGVRVQIRVGSGTSALNQTREVNSDRSEGPRVPSPEEQRVATPWQEAYPLLQHIRAITTVILQLLRELETGQSDDPQTYLGYSPNSPNYSPPASPEGQSERDQQEALRFANTLLPDYPRLSPEYSPHSPEYSPNSPDYSPPPSPNETTSVTYIGSPET